MLGDPRSGRKLWEALDRAISESGKDRGQIVADTNFQPPAAFHDRENRRDLGSRLCTADVYPVLPTECHGTHRVLRQVITQLKFRIFQESCKFPPQRERVLAGLAECTGGNAIDCATSILLRISSRRGLALS